VSQPKRKFPEYRHCCIEHYRCCRAELAAVLEELEVEIGQASPSAARVLCAEAIEVRQELALLDKALLAAMPPPMTGERLH